MRQRRPQMRVWVAILIHLSLMFCCIDINYADMDNFDTYKAYEIKKEDPILIPLILDLEADVNWFFVSIPRHAEDPACLFVCGNIKPPSNGLHVYRDIEIMECFHDGTELYAIMDMAEDNIFFTNITDIENGEYGTDKNNTDPDDPGFNVTENEIFIAIPDGERELSMGKMLTTSSVGALTNEIRKVNKDTDFSFLLDPVLAQIDEFVNTWNDTDAAIADTAHTIHAPGNGFLMGREEGLIPMN